MPNSIWPLIQQIPKPKQNVIQFVIYYLPRRRRFSPGLTVPDPFAGEFTFKIHIRLATFRTNSIWRKGLCLFLNCNYFNRWPMKSDGGNGALRRWCIFKRVEGVGFLKFYATRWGRTVDHTWKWNCGQIELTYWVGVLQLLCQNLIHWHFRNSQSFKLSKVAFFEALSLWQREAEFFEIVEVWSFKKLTNCRLWLKNFKPLIYTTNLVTETIEA